MPIYEHYCPDCHTLFNFFSRTVKPDRKPDCPKCGRKGLERQISLFAVTGHKKEEGAGSEDFPVDESRMESAMAAMAGELEGSNAEDPKSAAQMMRKLSRMTGLEFGGSMQEALSRMEAGEDPETIEAELGDRMEQEPPFILPDGGKGGKPAAAGGRNVLKRDPNLYDL